MSATVSAFGHRGTTSSVKTEIIRELVNASDGAGLHFDGSGVVAFTPVDLGSQFSHEFVLSTSEDLTTGTSSYIVDYHGSSDRFIIGFNPSQDSGNLAIFDNTGWESFGVNPLTDLKVHHIVVTVDGTSAVLYDNGNQVATATISASHGIDSATNAGLAGYYNNSNNFEGNIYRARVYNRALSSSEVRTAFERADVPFADQYGSQTDLTSGSFAGFGSFGTGVSESGGVLTATGGATGNIASKAIGLVANAVYRVQYEILTISGGSGVAMNPSGSGGLTPTRTSTGVYTETMTAPSDASGTINVYTSSSMGAFSGTLGNITVQRVGCVSDYDLAFANPTQSLTVQDRSGAAKGTASSSTAVTQVQKVVQGNLTSLAVGAGPVTPADNTIHLKQADGAYGIIHQNASGVKVATYTGSSSAFIGTQGSHSMGIATGGSEKLTIDSSGQVGIGTAPIADSKLDIAGTGTQRLYVRETGSTVKTKLLTTTSKGAVGTETNHPLELQTNDQTRVTIDSTGLATFSNGITVSGDVAYGDNGRVYHGNLPVTGPGNSNHDKFNFNFTFSGNYGVALITLDIAAGAGEVAAGRYTLAVSCAANTGTTTALLGSVTEVFKHNLSSLTFADSGSQNRTFTLSVERTVTAENWQPNASYKIEVTNNNRTLTLNSVTAST